MHRTLSPLIYREGTAIVPSRVRHHWAQRQYVKRFLNGLEADCVLDVGANIGGFGTELRLVGYQGLIISFEPDPECFTRLSRLTSKDPNWVALNVALGSTEESRGLNVMAAHVLNSFLPPSIEETKRLEGLNKVEKTVTVTVRTLDTMIHELSGQYDFRRPYLKMDTQGFDVEVFKGASSVLSQFVGMQSEVSLKTIYEGAPTWREAIAVYEAAGFEVTALYAVHPEATELLDMDCYLVNRRRN
ncbi:FkbM family methyltransferase [Mesorhizobium sp. M0959]|uniref:FkbM family methyltransferase n=1 Tax=unclassified Mesorhizobium TaxID=325217 RepID=UPI00333D12DD